MFASRSMTDPRSNSYFTKKTGNYQDQNNVDFNGNMNGVSNPIIWNFDPWPGSVLFKVYIEDEDVSISDYLDGMVQRLTLTPDRSRSNASATTITIYGRRANDKTSLSMTYKCYCNDDYYGPTCSVNCVEQDLDAYGHYTCDPYTGAEICRAGWEDVSKDCKTFSDDCVGNGCLNGAKCVDGIRSYTCACIDGYTGSSCETNINECASSPCLNGANCVDGIGSYTCGCGDGYTGVNCERECCTNDTCLNGGSCSNTNDTVGYECKCSELFSGPRCQSYGGMLFIILITGSAILFTIVVVLIAFLIYRRSRMLRVGPTVADKGRTTSTVPASSTK